MATVSGMNELERAIQQIVRDLEAHGRPWALVGGLAVSARTEPRTTRDVDVAVSVVDDADAEALLRGLMGDGYVVQAAVEQTDTGRLATVRLLPPRASSRSPIVDLLFASSGIELEVVAEADLLELTPGLTVPVATIGHLIAMKVLSRDDDRRPQDASDLRALLLEANPADLTAARTAIELISVRGFQRDRDLGALLEEAVVRYRGSA